MSMFICDRCNRLLDSDSVETIEGEDCTMVCLDCITDEEYEALFEE